MQIVRELGGYSLGQADLVRKAMSKKQTDVMERERINFVAGCAANGITEADAERIFNDMTDFAKYAFNKSHAAAYAVLAYQTAWLKVNYPVEFMAALLNSVTDHAGKVAEYIGECKKMGIELLPPDINRAYSGFSVSAEKADTIRYGLYAIKNVGKSAIDHIISEREQHGAFKSLTDFAGRIDSRDGNKRCIESLIKAGAFDCLGGTRLQYSHILKNVMDGAGSDKKRKLAGQMSLSDFMGGDDQTVEDVLPDVGEYALREMLDAEKEVLGIYLSGHPLSQYEGFIKANTNATTRDFPSGSEEADDGKLKDGDEASFGGIITKKSVKYTRSGKPMAFLEVEDMFGSLWVIIFPNIFETYSGRLNVDEVVAFRGRVSVKDDENASLVCNSLKFYGDETAPAQPSQELWLKKRIGGNATDDDISKILQDFPGNIPVIVYNEADKKVTRLPKSLSVRDAVAMHEQLKALLGGDAVILKAKK